MPNKKKVLLAVKSPVQYGRGIYQFNHLESSSTLDIESLKNGFVKHRVPDYIFTEGGNDQNPRRVYHALKNKAHVITRFSINELDLPSGTITSHGLEDVIDLALGVKTEEDLKKSVGNDFTDGYFANHKNELFLAIYRSDPTKYEVIGGTLFHSKTGKIKDLKAVDNSIKPTGAMVVDGDRLIVTCEKRLETLVKKNGQWEKENPLLMGKRTENILSLASKNGLTIVADRNQNYKLFFGNSDKPFFKDEGFDDAFDNVNGKYFDSEASSLLLHDYDGCQYLMAGGDECQIAIYKVTTDDKLDVEAFLDLDFFSRDYQHEVRKDNHVWNMKESGGYLSFSIRNLLITLNIGEMLDCERDQLVNNSGLSIATNGYSLEEEINNLRDLYGEAKKSENMRKRLGKLYEDMDTISSLDVNLVSSQPNFSEEDSKSLIKEIRELREIYSMMKSFDFVQSVHKTCHRIVSYAGGFK